MRVIGAGFPRTGTTSLKAALERLLGAPCYHMRELFGRPDDAAVWRDAYAGVMPDWHRFLGEYAAGVDWPVSWFWRELSAAQPDALVLLSRRESPERWYRSMDQTVLEGARRLTLGDFAGARPPLVARGTPEQARAKEEMMRAMFGGAFDDPFDRDKVIAAYERHLAEVRATVPAHRLLEWQPADGWQPLCAALGLPVPDEPFPHENTAADMRDRINDLGTR
ncbi:sulfotransferase family protein [Nonomuraea sp. NPDC005650]|uniref:sulfotransferase family protein n=1 Tax=Nonomuraea sp. NPDC005650 TaxID=3157045 RepID=UPI0033A7312D